ncbi:MAG: diadenylate cyclase CdaA [Acidobacteriota bacterium]|jgi:diadenylate cyclase|nr:diadenylate cyclase CdaA [Acidobacteriota bacterium]
MIAEFILNAFSRFSFVDILDIFFLFLLFYYLLLLIKGTKSYQMAIGLVLIGLISVIAGLLKLTAFSSILNNFLTYLIFAIIVLFQDELRKILTEIGSKLRTKYDKADRAEMVDEIVNAATALSLSKVGAIMAIEREINVKNYVNKPVQIDAQVSKDLLLTIFTPNSPLHDGAVIISKGRIELARCFFPLPPLLELSPSGTRHLAAIGITQQTDCLAVVVSEETGKISLAVDGELIRGLDREGLKKRLNHYTL